jgi:hypothetical protein
LFRIVENIDKLVFKDHKTSGALGIRTVNYATASSL